MYGLTPQNIGKVMNHGYAGSYARQPDMIANTHTAGAARLGKMARMLAHNSVRSVEFRLYGSFAQTYMAMEPTRPFWRGYLALSRGTSGCGNPFAMPRRWGWSIPLSPVPGPPKGKMFRKISTPTQYDF